MNHYKTVRMSCNGIEQQIQPWTADRVYFCVMISERRDVTHERRNPIKQK
jgi:hypothetical protein